VGAVIVNAHGLVLALERSDVADAWQLPQGGWELNETLEMAVFREIEEETGLGRGQLRLLRRCPEPLVYELPPERQKLKTGLGQVQYWFLLRTRKGVETLVLPNDGGEFSGWAWMTMAALIKRTVRFRRPVYRRLRACFGLR
jgi:putative (di)nucleoside polyphosphate hydrolase